MAVAKSHRTCSGPCTVDRRRWPSVSGRGSVTSPESCVGQRAPLTVDSVLEDTLRGRVFEAQVEEEHHLESSAIEQVGREFRVMFNCDNTDDPQLASVDDALLR